MPNDQEQANRSLPPPPRSVLKYRLQRLRMWYLTKWRYKFLHVGRGVYIGYDNRIFPNCVSIGDYCLVGGDHRFRDVGIPAIWSGKDKQRPIVIEDDVWIGHGATIMHGITIGRGAIVAAGALVCHDVPPYAIVGAKPSTVIGQRLEGEQARQHTQRLQELKQQLGLGEVTDRLRKDAQLHSDRRRPSHG